MVAATERHKMMMGKPRYNSDSTSASGGLLGGGGASCHQQDRQARDQQRITAMLISVVVVFLLCQLPQAFQHIYIVYYIIIGQSHTVYQMQVRACMWFVPCRVVWGRRGGSCGNGRLQFSPCHTD